VYFKVVFAIIERQLKRRDKIGAAMQMTSSVPELLQ
jgi:hypothetical protein